MLIMSVYHIILQKSVVEDALVLKIRSECRCNFNKSYLLNSNIDCKGNNQLTYTTTVEYSTDDGSETASIIAERILRQVPFSMMVGGSQSTVTSVQCTDCDIDITKASLSPADGGGLFFGGFIVAALIAAVLVIIAYVYMHVSCCSYYYVDSSSLRTRVAKCTKLILS